MEYRDLLRTSWRYLAFGSLLTCLGTLGSAYFVGLFNGDIRREFELSHADIGLVFSITTLASGPALIWLGRKIDDVDLRLYSISLFAGFAAGCFLVASSTSIIAIAAGIFLVRLIGDWLIVHTAVTSMARYFGSRRGTALGSGAVGYALGPAVFPVMAALLINSVGWRATWTAIGVAFLLVFIPLVLWLLRGEGEAHRQFLKPESTGDRRSDDGNASWSRLEVLRDVRFYLVMPVAIGLPFILSGFFFHQVALVEAKGWNLTRLASYFVGFAAGKAAIMLFIGPLIDRFGAARLLPFYPLAMAVGLFALAASDHPEIALAYLVGCGISTGMWMVMTGALWAELYGVAHLGAIRSMAQAIFILSTALGTAGMGWLLDLGFTFETIALASIVYLAVGVALSVFLARR
ncbi:MAG: MFS transporter [Rhodobacteraceae bacterium]|nr:MFS transporter [Paracoccaceae bacterium]MCY4137953.1 MFS transporter [Paracoccaceae bacterium]